MCVCRYGNICTRCVCIHSCIYLYVYKYVPRCLMLCTVCVPCLAVFQVATHFSRLIPKPSSQAQCSHNALLVVQALSHIGLEHDCQVPYSTLLLGMSIIRGIYIQYSRGYGSEIRCTECTVLCIGIVGV